MADGRRVWSIIRVPMSDQLSDNDPENHRTAEDVTGR